MEQSEWTEAQLIQLARDHGFPDVTGRKLKRFRREGVLSTPRVDHPAFGGTVSVYPAEAGPRVLAVCRLLKQKRTYDAVRVGLWLEGSSIEMGLLKDSFWRLVPFSVLHVPPTPYKRRTTAQELTQRIVKEAGKSVRTNMIRKVLRQFEHQNDQTYFTSMLTQLLYGVPVDFTRTFLGEHDADLSGILEEPADIFAHGLQVQQLRFLPKDIARDLQQLSEEQLLSLTRLKAVLYAATQQDLELARVRRDTIGQMCEALDLIGYSSRLLRLFWKACAKPGMQALIFVWLLVLEQSGYGPNIDLINDALCTNLPLIRRYQKLHQTLQQELPDVAKELLPLFQASRLYAEGSLQEQEAHIERVRAVYKQHKEALDTFWQDHPELADDTNDPDGPLPVAGLHQR